MLQRVRSISIGRAIRRIARLQHMKRVELATKLLCNVGVVTRLCGSYQYTTSWQQIVKYANALDVTPEELIRRAREEFYGNFFVVKGKLDPKESSDYKKEGLILFESETLDYKDFYVIPHTPPLKSPFDFFAATLGIQGGKSISNRALSGRAEIFIVPFQGGVEIATDTMKEEVIPGNSLTLRTSGSWTIRNLADSRVTEILVVIFPASALDDTSAQETNNNTKPNQVLEPYALLQIAREKLSPGAGAPLTLLQIAKALDLRQTSLKWIDEKKSVNLPLEELESLSMALGRPTESFTNPVHFNQPGSYLGLTKTDERYHMRLSTDSGVTFQTLVPIAKERRSFFAGELFLAAPDSEPLKPGVSFQAKHWSDQFEGFVFMMVLDGKPGLVVGKDRHYPNLERGETVYFNARLGFDLKNLSSGQTKLLLITYPLIC